MKRPSFQFYPGDWLRDTALRSCSVEARGLWIEMLCLMHEGCPYGYLKAGDKVILPTILARMVGASLQQVDVWLSELNSANVFSTDQHGCMFSRRMIKDEEVREKRAAGGFKSENNINVPRKKDISEGYPSPPSSAVSYGVSPSSASSSSSAKESKAIVASDAGRPDCPHKEIIALYHEHLPTSPSVRDWTPARSSALRARWNEDVERQNLEYWKGLFQYIAGIPFLTGKVNSPGRKPFLISLPWMLKSENFAKIREGIYE